MSTDKTNNCSENSNETDALLKLESDFFRKLLGRLEDPVFVKNNRHQWIFANQAFRDLIGCEDLIGKTDADLLPVDQVEKFYEGDNQVIRTQTSFTQEEEIGEGCYALVKKIPIRLPDSTIGLFGIIFDISEYRTVQLEVEKLRLAEVQSHTDPLTGLFNRRYLEEQFQRLIDENKSLNKPIGLLHIDLDYFKEINDTKGHLHGDAVLIHIANTLRSCLRKEDIIARIGGDEFVAVICGESQTALNAIADNIITTASQPVPIDSEPYCPSISVGVAADTTGISLNQMLKFADLALYRAKHNGRGRYEQFSPIIQKEHNEKRKQRDEFHIALAEHQFIPFYQPQFNTETLEVVGVEALARWNHPERGILLPADFLDLALSERRMVDLDREIFRLAMQDAREFGTSGNIMPALSINVSPQSLAMGDLIDVVKEIKPFANRVCFELVESMLLDEPNGVVTANLDALRNMGVSLDIDDFGSGHTSLLGMLEARPDRVKIDKRLVIPMTESQTHLGLIKSIIQMANSLSMETVAEGVESETHRQLLRTLGCTTIQGFGFARPMPLRELKMLLQGQAAA